MDQSKLIIFLILVFATVFLLSQVILVPSFGTKSKESRQIRKRLQRVIESVGTAPEQQSLVRQKYLHELSPLERWLESLPGIDNLESLIEQAGKTYPAYRLVLAMIALGIGGGIATWFFTEHLYATIAATFLIGWLPMVILKNDRDKRMVSFEEQLPEALDMMTRALRAGYPFNEAMRYISQEMQDPIAHEFGMTFEEINYGRDIKQAFNYLIMRVPSTNLIAATTAIIIQRETGGNLAELLDKITDVLRKRFRFQRRVKTITAEARMSAWVLSLLPFVVFLAISMRNPHYVQPLFDTKQGNYMLGLGLFLQVIGAFWVRKQIDFDI
jgi:tight adherence protein B